MKKIKEYEEKVIDIRKQHVELLKQKVSEFSDVKNFAYWFHNSREGKDIIFSYFMNALLNDKFKKEEVVQAKEIALREQNILFEEFCTILEELRSQKK